MSKESSTRLRASGGARRFAGGLRPPRRGRPGRTVRNPDPEAQEVSDAREREGSLRETSDHP